MPARSKYPLYNQMGNTYYTDEDVIIVVKPGYNGDWSGESPCCPRGACLRVCAGPGLLPSSSGGLGLDHHMQARMP